MVQVFEAFGILAFSFTNPLLPEVRRPQIHTSAGADCRHSMSAVAHLVFWLLKRCQGCAVDLQIQSVTKPPAVQNGKKGVTAAFGSAFILYPLVAISGFWYGLFGIAVLLVAHLLTFPSGLVPAQRTASSSAVQMVISCCQLKSHETAHPGTAGPLAQGCRRL